MYSNKHIWKVSYPIVLSLLAQNVINVTDTAFLGRVGEVELGAAAMGGLYYICIFTIAFGFSIGSQIVIARRNGEQQYADVGPVMIQGVFFLIFLAILLVGFSLFFAGTIMRQLISSDAILQATVEFLDWRVFGFFFSFVNVMFRALFIGITRTKVLTLNAVLMASTNAVLNYLLIFGHGGFPQMGIKGAAIASVIAEAVSILFFLVYTWITTDVVKYGLNRFRSFDLTLLKRVLGISIFTMLQYFLSMSTWFFFFIVVERIGQRELAIANIVRSMYVVMLIPVNALSTTTNSIVSNAIGAGHIDQVIGIIRKIARLSLFIMGGLVAVVVAMPHLFLSIYTNDAALIADSIPSLYVISGALLIAAVGHVVFSAVSGTGNTRPALMLELATLVVYTIYIYVSGVWLRLPVSVCFLSEVIYYTGMLVACSLYLKRASWQKTKI